MKKRGVGQTVAEQRLAAVRRTLVAAAETAAAKGVCGSAGSTVATESLPSITTARGSFSAACSRKLQSK